MERTALQPREVVFSANAAAPKYQALIEQLNAPRPDQSMGEATFEEICRRAWEAIPTAASWADTPERPERESYRVEVRGVLTAAADLMPIETLQGADGASVWLTGQE